jgi:PKHD-type hydroxylase
MNLKNYYFYFKSALSEKFCNDVLEYGKKQQEVLATTGKEHKIFQKNKKLTKKDIENLKKVRNSNVVWMNDRWIYDQIQPYIHEANKLAGWNFDWDYSESCQFTKYNKKQFYDWHQDSFEQPYDSPNDLNFNNKIRKLSVTCSLSDQNEYKGGELEFDFRNNEKSKPVRKICKEILPKGSIVVFPSFVWHRVRPVTKGTRYSLVIWNLGYPFK